MIGNIVFNDKIINQSGTLKFDLNDTKSGLYFVNFLVNGELKTTKRLIISK